MHTDQCDNLIDPLPLRSTNGIRLANQGSRAGGYNICRRGATLRDVFEISGKKFKSKTENCFKPYPFKIFNHALLQENL